MSANNRDLPPIPTPPGNDGPGTEPPTVPPASPAEPSSPTASPAEPSSPVLGTRDSWSAPSEFPRSEIGAPPTPLAPPGAYSANHAPAPDNAGPYNPAAPAASAPAADSYGQHPATPSSEQDATATAPYPDLQSPPSAAPPAQNPGSQNPYAQNPGSQNPYGQAPGSQNPYAQNPYAQNPYAQNAGYPVQLTAAPTYPQGLSIASMVCGIVGVLSALALFGILPSIAAVITGHIAVRREPKARAFWLTGIITGYAGIGITILTGLAILIPFLIFLNMGYSSEGYPA